MSLTNKLTDFFIDSPLAFMKTIPFKKVVFDNRGKYLCKFGCKKYGRNHSCPPASNILSEKIKKNNYKYALLVATTYSFPKDISRFQMKAQNSQKEMEIQRISTQLNNILTLNGIDHIVLSGGSCKKCRECSLIQNQKCKKPYVKLTSMEAVGIDCQKTMQYAGFDFEMPNYNTINRCAAILLNEEDISTINIKKIESYQKYKIQNKKQVEKMCLTLLEEYPKLFEIIEIKSVSSLEKETSICNTICKKNLGNNFSCPPYSNKIELDLWKHFVLWKWKENKIKKYSYNIALKKIHSSFFSLGFYFALSLRDCYCDECNQCTFSVSEKMVCNYRKLLSPSMQSQGINPIIFGEGKYGMELL